MVQNFEKTLFLKVGTDRATRPALCASGFALHEIGGRDDLLQLRFFHNTGRAARTPPEGRSTGPQSCYSRGGLVRLAEREVTAAHDGGRGSRAGVARASGA